MMPALRRASDGFRIVLVSSEAHRFTDEEKIKTALVSKLDPADYTQWGAYSLSKAANVMFAKELQRRFSEAGIRASAVSLHPGGVDTDLARYLFQGVDKVEAGVPKAETLAQLNPFQKRLASF